MNDGKFIGAPAEKDPLVGSIDGRELTVPKQPIRLRHQSRRRILFHARPAGAALARRSRHLSLARPVRSQNKTLLEDVSFKVKKGTSLAIVGPNGGGKTTLFRALPNLMRYTGTIKWNGKVRMGYVPQSLVSTDLPILVEEFLRFKCRTDFETCINSVGLEIIISLSKRLKTQRASAQIRHAERRN